MKKVTAVLCALAAMLMLAAGCGSDAKKDAAPAKADTKKVLTVGTNRLLLRLSLRTSRMGR